MPFLPPSQQHQGTEGNGYNSLFAAIYKNQWKTQRSLGTMPTAVCNDVTCRHLNED